MDTDARFAFLQQALLDWFAAHRRPLPWREHYTPYSTWIAEVMMQQTQMERGVAYYRRWMERFPDAAAVAEAPEEDLLKAWEGLGYYRRARNIQAAARVIMTRYKGRFPSSPEALRALPGIGPYTAGAIASTAFNRPVPCVDGNVERVLSRLFDIDSPVKTEPAKSRILDLAIRLIPEGRARDFNQALMELGALVCRKKPLCEACPVRQVCEALRLGIAEERPVAGRRAGVVPVEAVTGVLLHETKLFIQRRLDEGVWAGLWEFPGGCIESGETPEQALIREWREELDFEVDPGEKITVLRHGYTTYRITLHCFLIRFRSPLPPCPEPPALREASAYRWISPEELDGFPLPAPHRKLADLLAERKILCGMPGGQGA